MVQFAFENRQNKAEEKTLEEEGCCKLLFKKCRICCNQKYLKDISNMLDVEEFLSMSFINFFTSILG